MKTIPTLHDVAPQSAIADPTGGASAAGASWLHGRMRVPRPARAVLAMLEKLAAGSLHLTLPDNRTLAFGRGEPHAHVRILDWRVFATVLRRGDIGFAESWIAGYWTSPSLIDVIDVSVANRQRLEQVVYGAWWGQLFYRLKHLLNRNSQAGSRRNIHAHYDLGNAFYQLWLDPTMTYSSALFDDDATRTLEQGQRAKYQRLVDQLGLSAGQSVLEIGCGWGGFAEHAAARGLRVTGLTISTEQLAFAQRRLARLGLVSAPQLRLQDYRQEQGQYDAIVSIEMFEAVGEQYWPSYFATVARCLRRSGRAAIQSIVIADELFERYRSNTDFIQQYVFPGGMLPTKKIFIDEASKAGLECVQTHAFGADYATTLALWRRSCMAQSQQVLKQGFDARFIRLWEFYLAYCESAFKHRNTDVVQFTLVKR
jgi:cyclopropane-fatty-acyl-phospholipid synthase